MTSEEDKLISEVLGETPASEGCLETEPDESASNSPPSGLEPVAVSAR